MVKEGSTPAQPHNQFISTHNMANRIAVNGQIVADWFIIKSTLSLRRPQISQVAISYGFFHPVVDFELFALFYIQWRISSVMHDIQVRVNINLK